LDQLTSSGCLGGAATYGLPDEKPITLVAATGELVSSTVAVVGKAPTSPVAVSVPDAARMLSALAPAVEIASRSEDGAEAPS